MSSAPGALLGALGRHLSRLGRRHQVASPAGEVLPKSPIRWKACLLCTDQGWGQPGAVSPLGELCMVQCLEGGDTAGNM